MNTVEHICESDDEDNEADYFFAIVPGLDRPQFDLQINGFKVKVLVDSGAQVNQIDQVTFDALNRKPRLAPA